MCLANMFVIRALVGCPLWASHGSFPIPPFLNDICSLPKKIAHSQVK